MMKSSFAENTAGDSDSSRPTTFDNDGQYTHSTITQGNTYHIRGALYMTAPKPPEIGLDPNKADTTLFKKLLLESLYFDEMSHRQEHVQSLVDDFGLTCRWIVTPGKDHGFLSWYKEDGGLFWISGLAGTGKSTLMDFLDQELSSTTAHLSSPRLLRHFFSLTDTSAIQQKSLEGLYRALCHQILAEHADLMDQLVQNASSLSFVRPLRSSAADGIVQKWTMRALRSLFQYLVDHSKCRYLLIIDGLDECGDDHEELLKTLDNFLTPGTKIVCSSRPDEPFRSGLKHHKMIKLQDVNASDIRKFCERTLQHSRAIEFVGRIVRMSEGIFLWAAIVALDLRRESRVLESEDLEKRLEQCPSGMFRLYQHMLERQRGDLRPGRSLPPYLLVLHLWKKLDDGETSSASYGTALVVLFVIGLMLENNKDDFRRIVQLDWLERCREKVELIEAQVLTSCAGMVRVVDIGELHDSDAESESESEYSHSEDDRDTLHGKQTVEHRDRDQEISARHTAQIADLLTKRRVVLVHQTASDFLNDEEIENRLWMKYKASKPDIMLAITKVLLSHPSNWTNDCLSFDLETHHRFGRLCHHTELVEADLEYRTKLYSLLLYLLNTPPNVELSVPEAIKQTEQRISSSYTHSNGYTNDHSLSTLQNFVCNWMVRKINVPAFLDYAESSNARISHVSACMLAHHWAGSYRYTVGMMSKLLSLSKVTTSTTYHISLCEARAECFVVWPIKETSLWTIFVSFWLGRRAFAVRHPPSISHDPYYESFAWFRNAHLSSNDEIQMNLLIVVYKGNLYGWKISPRGDDESCRLFNRCDDQIILEVDPLVLVFGMEVLPAGVLPLEAPQQSSPPSNNHTGVSPVQFTSFRVQGTKGTVQLPKETSTKLCDLMGLGWHCLGEVSSPVGDVDQFGELIKSLIDLAKELLITNEHEFGAVERARLVQALDVEDPSARLRYFIRQSGHSLGED